MTPICCSESHYAAAITSGAGNSSSSGDRDYNISQGSYVVSKKEIVYHNFMMNDGEENHFDSSDEEDVERDDSGTSKTEDFEVRMDLTDDLLHMVCVHPQFPLFQQLFPFLLLLQYIYFFVCCCQVFSFLDHINLCRAAMVCRQWRAASTHEDFWRCLNFENRNIYLEQCK